MFVGIPPLLIGFIIGYLLGGRKGLRPRDRVLVALAFGVIGGLISSMLLSTLAVQLGIVLTQTDAPGLLGILAFTGGLFLGMALNWTQLEKAQVRKARIVFDPDDDDEFDRQIEQAFSTPKD
jgi:hypothetical protein